MKLHNKSQRAYQHSYYDKDNKLQVLYLRPNEVVDSIPDEIAKLWLATGDVVEFADPIEVKEEKAKSDAEKMELEEENSKLRAENEKLQEEKAKSDAEKMELLKNEANRLEIKYPDNISFAKLLEKVEAEKNKQ